MSDIAVGTIEQFQEAARDVVRADIASMIGTQLTPSALASALADLAAATRDLSEVASAYGDTKRERDKAAASIARAESILSAYRAQSDGETGGAS